MKNKPIAVLMLICALLACAVQACSAPAGDPPGLATGKAHSGLSFTPTKVGTISPMYYTPCTNKCWGGNGCAFFDPNNNRCISGDQLPNGQSNSSGGVGLLQFQGVSCDWSLSTHLLLWTTEQSGNARGRVERPLKSIVMPPAGNGTTAPWTTAGWAQAAPNLPWEVPGAKGVTDAYTAPLYEFNVPNNAVNYPHSIDVSGLAQDACANGGPCIFMLRSILDDGDAYDDAPHYWLITASVVLQCSAPPVCGNGITQSGEGCDDGDVDDGDGCSSTCTVEAGFTCQSDGSPSVCVEAGTTTTTGSGGTSVSSGSSGGAAGATASSAGGTTTAGSGGTGGSCD